MGRYTVWCEDLGQEQSDGKKFAEGGPREAATEWARWNDWNSAEYAIVGGKDAEVCVYDEHSGAVSRWTVSGEAVPQYRARPATSNASVERPSCREEKHDGTD